MIRIYTITEIFRHLTEKNEILDSDIIPKCPLTFLKPLMGNFIVKKILLV